MDDHNTRRKISKRRHSSRTHHSRSRSKLIAWLSLGCAFLFFVALVMGIQLGVANREINYLTIIESKQQRELDALRPKIDELQAQISDLTESRIPGLEPLKFDQVIALNRSYVRNINFTLAKKNDSKRYEYKMVLDNRGLTAVHPHVSLLFFNDIGIQVGSSEVGVDADGVLTLDVLERGEIRPHSSVVDLSVDADPTYFFIRIIEPKFD